MTGLTTAVALLGVVLGVDSSSHTVALAGVEGVVEKDQNPAD